MNPALPALAALIGGYVLSQFYRAFLAVLAPTLQAEIGATPGDLALSSGLWFAAFAALQIPIGRALDRVGPRWTSAGLLGLGGAGGAAVFAMAGAPWHLHVAMALLGAGCAPVLMAAYVVIGRHWPGARFGALAGLVVGIGSAGNILGASPLVAAIERFGWRPTLWACAGVTLVVAAGIAALVRDPAPAPRAAGGGLREVLRLPVVRLMLPLMAVNYAASAAIRGVWVAPYAAEVQGADARAIGFATLVMGLAMIAGNLAVGPAVRLAGGTRRAVIAGTGLALAALGALAVAPGMPWPAALAALAVLGMTGAVYAVMMSHARPALPPHLLGTGLTLLNMASIGGVGVMQFATRPVYGLPAEGPEAVFTRLFLTFAVPLAVGLAIFRRAPDAPR